MNSMSFSLLLSGRSPVAQQRLHAGAVISVHVLMQCSEFQGSNLGLDWELDYMAVERYQSPCCTHTWNTSTFGPGMQD